MPLYLGIDAGGTKTDCAVSNGAELLGQATGASCKLARVGKERGRENLQAVIRQATETAHVDAGKIQHVCIGMAGASLAEAVHWAQQTIRELMPESTMNKIISILMQKPVRKVDQEREKKKVVLKIN